MLSGSQVRLSQPHNPSSPLILNNTQPKPMDVSPQLLLPTTILSPPQPAQPVRDEAELSTTTPPISSPLRTQARDSGALHPTFVTLKSRVPSSSSEVPAKPFNRTAPENPRASQEKNAAWRVSVAPPVAPPSVHGSESQNLRWTKNQSPPPNKAITPMSLPSNATPNRATVSPKKQFQSSDGHFGQFRGDASIKLEDVMPSLSRHFGDSNSYNMTIMNLSLQQGATDT
jgi:hypothetical protein